MPKRSSHTRKMTHLLRLFGALDFYWLSGRVGSQKSSEFNVLPDDRVLVVDVLGHGSQFADEPLHTFVRADDVRVDFSDARTQSVNCVGVLLVLWKSGTKGFAIRTVWRGARRFKRGACDANLPSSKAPSTSRFLRPKANGLNRARPPMATKGTATAAAKPGPVTPRSETALRTVL